ncbi:MAG: hypothetical protein AAB336_03315 [Acidobacteriota bacterium]
MKYVIEKDEKNNKVHLIGRFQSKGIGEIWRNGKWVESSTLHSSMLDGLLEEITEAEALKLISQKQVQELQVA